MSNLESNINNDMLVNSVINDSEILLNDNILMQFLDLPLNKLSFAIRNMDEQSIKNLLSGNEDILLDKIDLIILNVKEDEKLNILANDKFLKKLLLTKPNRLNKQPFDYLSNNLKSFVLTKKDLIDEIDNSLYKKLISKINDNDIDEIWELSKSYKPDINEIIDYIKDTYNIDYNKAILLSKQIINQNYLRIYKFKNEYELDIYTKFGYTVEVDKIDSDIIINNCAIPINLINNINVKHIKGLLNKAPSSNDKNKTLEIIIKLYCIFGYDNTAKILDNKFTNMNDNAITRAATDSFIDARRQYRLENQYLFYSNDLLEEAKQALKTNDVSFFEKIIDDIEKAPILFNQLKAKIQGDEDKDNLIISFYLKTMINERENNLKNDYIFRYCNSLIEGGILNDEKISIDKLYNKLGAIDIKNVILDNDGRPIINKDLNDFLLGNYKKDNDCILRLVFNNQALGLNDTISIVINNFSKIKRVIDKSNSKLSINSILDVIDVFKVLFYKLEPNEQDMTLVTISKLLKSTEYCTEPKEVIFERARKLHVDRRKKSYATIPSVQGVTKDLVSYKVMLFDDPSLITLGIDTGCCLKVGGKGEDFLNYCLKSNHAVVVRLKYKNKNYMCPFIRNGNGLYGNGIDPKPDNDEITLKLLDALKDFGNSVINSSSGKEPIEFVTITDLHNKDFFDKTSNKKIKIDSYLPIDSEFYSDYHKKEITNYIIASKSEENTPMFYIPTIKYYQNRVDNYIYKVDNEIDKERISIQINSINYDLIDCMNCSEKEKHSLKRKYVPINVDDYDYIVGNKDWFIAISELNIISGCLPYDERAKLEYYEATRLINEEYVDMGVIKK